MSIVTAAIIGAGASLIGGAVASNQQSKARSAAERRQQAAKREIEAQGDNAYKNENYASAA